MAKKTNKQSSFIMEKASRTRKTTVKSFLCHLQLASSWIPGYLYYLPFSWWNSPCSTISSSLLLSNCWGWAETLQISFLPDMWDEPLDEHSGGNSSVCSKLSYNKSCTQGWHEMSVIGNMTSVCGLWSSFSILEPLTPYVEEPNGFSLTHSNCHHFLKAAME